MNHNVRVNAAEVCYEEIVRVLRRFEFIHKDTRIIETLNFNTSEFGIFIPMNNKDCIAWRDMLANHQSPQPNQSLSLPKEREDQIDP